MGLEEEGEQGLVSASSCDCKCSGKYGMRIYECEMVHRVGYKITINDTSLLARNHDLKKFWLLNGLLLWA